MDRDELLETRKALFDEYTQRKSLGEFDANSKTILLLYHSLINVLNHLLETSKKSK